MIDTFILVGKVAGAVCSVGTLAALLVKPVREWLFGVDAARDGQRCLLRAEIVRIYYRNREDKTLREYEFRNMSECYAAYKRLGGNSFVEHIFEEMQHWDVTQ